MQPSAPNSSPDIPIATSIQVLIPGREAWLTDIWGVIHNGVEPYAPACDACTRFRLAGGVVLLLSNSPRPAQGVIEQLDRIGVPRFAWDAIVTSGDATRALLEAHAGRRTFHLGPERDLPLYDGLGVTLSAAKDAEVISCTGLFDDEIEGPDDYAAMLQEFAARRLPLICANPDRTVERGGKIVFCAGALAEAYEQLGGNVAYAGKPHIPIYAMAFERLAQIRGRTVTKDRILAIGDGILTDVKGAAAAGVDSVFIASGIHVSNGNIDNMTLSKLFPDPAGRPIAAMRDLVW
jgi:HAD superfamily hydrolase (TIGR01459 family)